MTDADRARRILEKDGRTCVLCRGRVTHLSGLPGILPMVRLLDSSADVSGFAAADRVVGKAAALLFARAGVASVYAPVMSASAVEVLTRFDIEHSCDRVVDGILNRNGTGPCPIEASVSGIEDPAAARAAIGQALDRLAAVSPAVRPARAHRPFTFPAFDLKGLV